MEELGLKLLIGCAIVGVISFAGFLFANMLSNNAFYSTASLVRQGAWVLAGISVVLLIVGGTLIYLGANADQESRREAELED